MRAGPFWEADLREWWRGIEVNTLGAAYDGDPLAR
jgi:hypothetical protein